MCHGDSHYGRAKAMDWCETNDVGYILGLARNAEFERLCEADAYKLRLRHAANDQDKMRAFCSSTYRARSRARERRRAPRNATRLLSAIWRAAVVV